MLNVTPFLLFDGNCAEAMIFYQKCIGGELTLTKLGDTSMKEMFPPEKYERLINAHLKSGNIEISATDWMASPAREPKQGNTMSIFLVADDNEKLRKVFEKLSEGASKDSFQDLHYLPFGLYGQFTDKFGVPWIFKGEKKGE
jgi:PhnB protein